MLKIIERENSGYWEDGEYATPLSERMLTAATLINAVALVSLFGVVHFFAAHDGVSAMLSYLPQHPLGIPAVILVVWSAIKRMGRPLVVNCAALVFFIIGFMGYNVPVGLAPGEYDRELRVMTFNVHHGWSGPDKVSETIMQANPDVICLQESERYYPKVSKDLATRRFFSDYEERRVSDLCTMSKYPIKSVGYHILHEKGRSYALATTLDVDGTLVTVINVHFVKTAWLREGRPGFEVSSDFALHSEEVRNIQMRKLVELIYNTHTPVVVAGDFNTPPRGLVYKEIADRLQDAFCAAGWGLGYTFHSKLPLTRIDYVFHDKDISTLSCTEISGRASDHLPVVADLGIDNTAGNSKRMAINSNEKQYD